MTHPDILPNSRAPEFGAADSCLRMARCMAAIGRLDLARKFQITAEHLESVGMEKARQASYLWAKLGEAA